MARKKRNYKKEYADYHGKPQQIKRRSQRNQARRAAEKRGAVTKGDNREVHHVNAPRTGSLNNKKTRVISKASNRRMQPKRTRRRG